jgi:DNA-binding IclR family transcriptional regulator
MAEERSETGVRSVQLALDVLEAVAFSGEELGVTQLAERLDVTKASVHRHLLTLVERGYLVQNPSTARYGIGAKSRLLARTAPETDLVRLAEGPMWELREALGHTVVLSEMTPRGALVLTTVQGTSPIEIGVRPGSELSLHGSAQGKIMLAFSPRPQQERVLARALERFTANTIVEPKRLDDEIARANRLGYVSAPEETMLGLNAIAAPIFDHRDACIAAVAVVGSIQFLPSKPDAQVVAALKSAAQRISRALGQDRLAAPSEPRPTRRKSA